MSTRSVSVSVPSGELAEALSDDLDLVVWDLTGPSPRHRLDIVVLPYQQDPARARAVSAVDCALVQTQTIGYEDVLAHLPRGARIANAASVHEASTAELALALTLASLRRLPDYVRAAADGRWHQEPGETLAGRTVTVVGHGGVGRAIAARLAAFETHVTAVARTARGDVRALADLPQLLGRTEILVLAVPLTDETRHLVDDALLSALPDGALVVNASRGAVVDTDALLEHVRRGRLRAALDVVDPEPLPRDHPLWQRPEVLITPHIGGATASMTARMAALVTRQAAALAAGAEPENLVRGA